MRSVVGHANRHPVVKRIQYVVPVTVAATLRVVIHHLPFERSNCPLDLGSGCKRGQTSVFVGNIFFDESSAVQSGVTNVGFFTLRVPVAEIIIREHGISMLLSRGLRTERHGGQPGTGPVFVNDRQGVIYQLIIICGISYLNRGTWDGRVRVLAGLTTKVEVESLLERKLLIENMLGKTRSATMTTKTTATIVPITPAHLLFLGSGMGWYSNFVVASLPEEILLPDL